MKLSRMERDVESWGSTSDCRGCMESMLGIHSFTTADDPSPESQTALACFEFGDGFGEGPLVGPGMAIGSVVVGRGGQISMGHVLLDMNRMMLSTELARDHKDLSMQQLTPRLS